MVGMATTSASARFRLMLVGGMGNEEAREVVKADTRSIPVSRDSLPWRNYLPKIINNKVK